MMIEEEIVIVGGGIAGLATALALKRVGFQSRVLERNPELRAGGTALTLLPNAWFALKALGVDHKLKSAYQPLTKSLIINLAKGTTREVNIAGTKNNRDPNIVARSVHRKALLQVLAEELPPDAIRFYSKLISIKSATQDDSSSATLLHLEDGTIIRAKVVIGCDGVHSAVAQWLGLSQPLNSGRWAARGLAVFPEGHGFQGVKMFVGTGTKAGLVTLNSKEIYWFISTYSSLERDVSADPELLLDEVEKNIAKDLPSEFLSVLKHTDLSTLSWVPILYRAPWNIAFGKAQEGGVTVAGDAMHPMTPDIAQGGCSALEDAVILARCISQSHSTSIDDKQWVDKALKRYVEERRWRMTWLASGAWLAGWVMGGGGDQQWWLPMVRLFRPFRDLFYYRFAAPRISDLRWFDCGDLTPENKRD